MFDFRTGGVNYESLLGKSHKYYMRIKCDELLKIMRTSQPQRILDIGCGTGQAEEVISNKARRIHCVDTSASMLSFFKYKRLNNCLVSQADTTCLPFEDGAFDLTFSIALFHHLGRDKWGRAVEEMHRVTKRGGLIVCFEHNPRNPVTRYFVGKCAIDETAVLIPLKEMKSLFREDNIKILDVRYVVFLPYPFTFLYPIERALHRLPLGGQYMLVGIA